MEETTTSDSARFQTISAEELVTGYLAEREHVAQLAVESLSINHANKADAQSRIASKLRFYAHYGRPEEPLPEIIADADAVSIDGKEYGFTFEETNFGPQYLGRLTLYMPNTVRGCDGCTVEQGLTDLTQALSERTANIHSLVQVAKAQPRVIAVVGEQFSSRLQLSLIRDGPGSPSTDRFGHIEEVEIGNKVFRLGGNPWGLSKHMDRGTVVWQSANAGLGDEIPIEEGIKALKAEI